MRANYPRRITRPGDVWSRCTEKTDSTKVVIRHKKSGKYIKDQGRPASLVDDFKDAHVWNRMGDASNAMHHVIHAEKIKKELELNWGWFSVLSPDEFEKLTCLYRLELWEKFDEEVEIDHDDTV